MAYYSALKKEIKKAESIAIYNHVNMDGDAVGSAFSLASALKNKGKKVKVVLEKEPPLYLKGFCDEYCYNLDEVFDLAIAVDCGDEGRLGDRKDEFFSAKKTVCIDHHISNKGFSDINYVNPSASSTSEMVFFLIKEIKAEITKRMAEQLYAGIITDTGGFKFSNTTPESFSVSSELLSYGVDIAEVCIDIYESDSLAKLKLKSKALDSLKLYEGGKISSTVLLKKDFEETGAVFSDCEGFSQIGRAISGVEASFLVTSYDEVRVSLRSKRYVDVSRVASFFGGGGHKRASGFTLSGEVCVEKLVEQIIEKLSEELKGNDR